MFRYILYQAVSHGTRGINAIEHIQWRFYHQLYDLPTICTFRKDEDVYFQFCELAVHVVCSFVSLTNQKQLSVSHKCASAIRHPTSFKAS